MRRVISKLVVLVRALRRQTEAAGLSRNERILVSRSPRSELFHVAIHGIEIRYQPVTKERHSARCSLRVPPSAARSSVTRIGEHLGAYSSAAAACIRRSNFNNNSQRRVQTQPRPRYSSLLPSKFSMMSQLRGTGDLIGGEYCARDE